MDGVSNKNTISDTASQPDDNVRDQTKQENAKSEENPYIKSKCLPSVIFKTDLNPYIFFK